MIYQFTIQGTLISAHSVEAERIFNNISGWLDIAQIPNFQLTYTSEAKTIGKNFEPPEAY